MVDLLEEDGSEGQVSGDVNPHADMLAAESPVPDLNPLHVIGWVRHWWNNIVMPAAGRADLIVASKNVSSLPQLQSTIANRLKPLLRLLTRLGTEAAGFTLKIEEEIASDIMRVVESVQAKAAPLLELCHHIVDGDLDYEELLTKLGLFSSAAFELSSLFQQHMQGVKSETGEAPHIDNAALIGFNLQGDTTDARWVA